MGAQSDTQEIFDDQEQNEELVEVANSGNVHKPGEAPKGQGEKSSFYRDPDGEFFCGVYYVKYAS